VNHLLERGSWLEPGRIEAPRTIRRMIELNFERLDADEQHLLEAASAAGVEFSAAAVAAAVERPLNEVEAGCTYLSRQEKFVSASGIDEWPDGTVASSFRFRHALYRDVLYESLPAGHRGELHQRIAQRKERGYGGRADEIAAELAHHYSHANDKNKALGYLQLAGEQATKRAAFKEATGLIESALKLLDELPSETARLRAEFALRNLESTIAFARYGGASPQRERAIRRLCLVGEHLGEKEHLLSLLSLCNFYFHRGEEIRGTELAHRCLSLAKATRDAGLLADACAVAVLLANLGGKFRDALSHYETFLRADGMARASASPASRNRNGIPYEIWSGTASAIPLQLLGHVGEALKSNEQSLKRARESRHLLSVAFVLTVMADNLRCFRREPEVARAEAEEGIAIAEENGFVYWFHVGRFVHGWALADLGQLEQGIAEMERGLGGFRELGGWAFQQYAMARLAYAYARTGRKEEGLAMLNDALEESERTGGQMANAEMLRLKGEMLLLHVGTATGEAERCFRVAVDVARAQEARWWELRASVSLARFLRDTGRRDEARAMLAEIYNWFTEGFETADLKDAKALLEELLA